METVLGDNAYGKQRVRLVKVERGTDRHVVRDLTVGVRLRGDFTAAHVAGDNSAVLPTDTMRNTVYALAAESPLGPIERFGARIAERLIRSGPEVAEAEVTLEERPWTRLEVDGAPHPHAFAAAAERRTATVWRGRPGGWTAAGIADLVLLKTTDSAFSGFRRDDLTTLRETEDRILATRVAARWRYMTEAPAAVDYDASFTATRRLLLETFARHHSRSVQHTLYAMAESVLQARPEIEEVHLSLPNIHHIPFDLTPLGLENRNEVFLALAEPHGLIEATVRRR
ncbi:MAG: factor-independent urate hydroxylase [Thermoanaerobaculia bacterium]